MLNFRTFGLLVIAILIATGTFGYVFSNDAGTQNQLTFAIDAPPFLKTYVIPNEEASQLEVHFIVQSGESDVTGPEGRAHYVEHLAWISAVGASTLLPDRHSNAWTTNYATGYWLTGNTTDLSEYLATLTKTLLTPSLDPKFAETEAKIVFREYEMRVGGNPYGQLSEALSKEIYAGNALARSTIGTPAAINEFNRADAIKLHDATHRAGNTVIVVSGPVLAVEVKAALSKLETISKGLPPSALPEFRIASTDRKQAQFDHPELAKELVWRKIVKLNSPMDFDLLEFRLALLRDVLDTNLPGGIAKPLRFDAFIAERYTLALQPIDESHFEIIFSARPDKGVSLDQLLVAFEASLEDTADSGIPPETYSRVFARFGNTWPNWDDKKMAADWMKDYILRRVANRRQPLDATQIQALEADLTITWLNGLILAAAGPGRVRFAKIGDSK